MAKKNKGGTPTERAQKAEAGRKAASSRAKNLNEKLAEVRAKSSAALKKARAALASQGAKRIGTAAAGGALAGAAHAVIGHYATQGTFGETVGEYLSNPKIAGAAVSVLGAGAVIFAEKKGGKNKAMLAEIGAGMVAGGAAIATDPLVRSFLPGAVNGLPALPAPVGQLRVVSADQAMRLNGYQPRRLPAPVGQLRPVGQPRVAVNDNGFR
jgi:hypothetical protein